MKKEGEANEASFPKLNVETIAESTTSVCGQSMDIEQDKIDRNKDKAENQNPDMECSSKLKCKVIEFSESSSTSSSSVPNISFPFSRVFSLPDSLSVTIKPDHKPCEHKPKTSLKEALPLNYRKDFEARCYFASKGLILEKPPTSLEEPLPINYIKDFEARCYFASKGFKVEDHKQEYFGQHLAQDLSISKVKVESGRKNEDIISKYVHKKFRTHIENIKTQKFHQKRKTVIFYPLI